MRSRTKSRTMLIIQLKEANCSTQVEPNSIYNVRFFNQNVWRRAILKFKRKDDVFVMDYMDTAGCFDFNPKLMELKKIKSSELINLPAGEFEFMVFAVKKFGVHDEFKIIFEDLCRQQVTRIFGLIEEKENRLNECYAGDLLYEFRGKWISFREQIIQEAITYPAGVRQNLNKKNFRQRLGRGLFIPTSAFVDFNIFGEGYKSGEILGEGGVCMILLTRDLVKPAVIFNKIF